MKIAKEHIVEQRSDEWFELRLGRATASRFADIIGKTKSGYSAGRANYKAELVIERLTGEKFENFSSKAMQWGTETEDLARQSYELATHTEVKQTGIFVHKKLMCAASPDGLIGKDGTLEIKCPNPATHIETLKRQAVPKKYIPQVQGQLWLTDRAWADFESYDPRMPRHARRFIIRVHRDEEYIKMLDEEITKFLKEVDEEVEFVKNYKQPTKKEKL